ncbi:MAG TPA: hypothetical protein VL523_03095, partial [Terriglobia bacterium]|nr:hypothetical protein [Terriglobia bacterium]
NSAQFGKLFSYPVDGAIYAQPLYVQSVTIPDQGVHNVVYVATEHDSVYAFDADGKTTSPLWHVSFIDPPEVTPIPYADTYSADIAPEVGITGTPVIDPVQGVLYVVANTAEGGGYAQRLHALDITTGAEMSGGPALLSASVPGTGDGSSGGTVSFNALRNGQRPALMLLNGIVYVAWASHGDADPYHGWLMGFDARTLKQVSAFNATPNGRRGGIWQSGGGPSADEAGNIYLMTGNGTFDASSGGLDYGDSFLKLSTPGGLSVADYFTPFDQANRDATDADVGSGGTLVIPDQPLPHSHLLVGSDKEGFIFLLNRDDLGGFNAQNNGQILQTVWSDGHQTYSTLAFWQNNIYIAGRDDGLRQFPLTDGQLSALPIAKSSATFGSHGATPCVSANGAAGGIVWVTDISLWHSAGAAVLHAFDATDVSHELYNSQQNAQRDQAGPAVKFVVPTVFNGKVYLGTASELDVYGILVH